MNRLLKFSVILIFIITVLCPSGLTFAQENDSLHLVSPELLKHANLKIVWENILPLNENETMEEMFIIGDQIYLISNRNFTMSLDRQTGRKIFNRNLAIDGLVAEDFVDANDQIIYIVGNRYIQIEKQSGIEKEKNEVDFGISAPVVRNNSFFYVSGSDNRLHVLKEEKKVEVFKVAGNDDGLITSVAAADDFVVFGTNKGNLYSMMPDEPKSYWEFEAAGGFVGNIIRDSNSLFFACDDMSVYRIDVPDIYTNSFIWKTLVPGIIKDTPRITNDVIYQTSYSKKTTVSAIDRDSGRIIWEVPGGKEFLAQSRGRAYVVTQDGMLVVMHNASAKQVYSVNFASVSRQACNTIDSKIYIGDKTGRVACLEPLN